MTLQERIEYLENAREALVQTAHLRILADNWTGLRETAAKLILIDTELEDLNEQFREAE